MCTVKTVLEHPCNKPLLEHPCSKTFIAMLFMPEQRQTQWEHEEHNHYNFGNFKRCKISLS